MGRILFAAFQRGLQQSLHLVAIQKPGQVVISA